MFDPSLADLVIFAPSDSAVNQYISQTNSDWTKGKYWLGGQIALLPDDKITGAIINKVRRMFDYSDSYESDMEVYDHASMLESVLRCRTQLSQIEIVVKKYQDVAKQRLTDDLNKTKLNSDVNSIIVSMCG